MGSICCREDNSVEVNNKELDYSFDDSEYFEVKVGALNEEHLKPAWPPSFRNQISAILHVVPSEESSPGVLGMLKCES